MPATIDHRQLYRLPWNLADNPIVWLEPTDQCNLACDGCYRKNTPTHKSLEAIDADLDVFARLRTFDGVSIAGGDPLMHPEVLAIVERISRRGYKPIINTNGHALTKELLRDLKAAGLAGFTFHVDSKQGRPAWKGADEVRMNDLRSEYAEMVASVGGIACAFNSTVYPDTLHQVPEILDWAQAHVGQVHNVVFIIFRHADLSSGSWDYYAGGKKVEVEKLVYAEKEKRRIDITAPDVVEVIRSRYPDFEPAAYLNGTERPDSFKWMASMRLVSKDEVFGWATAKWMEAAQTINHLVTGRYLAYSPPWTLALGAVAASAGAIVDRGMRGAMKRYAGALARRPWRVAGRAHLQAVTIIQPIDLMADGSANMCDGCPDVTVHDGRLVWSCRLEEPRKYGVFLRCVPQGFQPPTEG
ncbi:MAG TPA: radical SAM protein [Polyangia bacterium]|jgi:MoaA/NifB/PqqE/SkfB family radical SAM enzyme